MPIVFYLIVLNFKPKTLRKMKKALTERGYGI
jgi:hypothetical protein